MPLPVIWTDAHFHLLNHVCGGRQQILLTADDFLVNLVSESLMWVPSFL